MTTYYISPNGSDSNNGLGPDASHATNKPFLTLGKVLVTGSPLAAGDIAYVAPGYYYSSGNYTVLGSISSAGSPTQIIGDPTNKQGFKNGSGVLLAPGIPWVTTRTSGEGLDVPIAATAHLFTATTNDPSGLQFKNLALETGMAYSLVLLDPNGSTDIIFEDCLLLSGTLFNFTTGGAATANRNHKIRRCSVYCNNMLFMQSTVAAATADADLNILVEESFIFGKMWGANFAVSASGGNLGGGIYFYNNTIVTIGGPSGATVAGKISTTTPIRFKGNLIFSGGAIMSAGTAGQIIDDGYNRIFNPNPGAGTYSNVTQNVTSGQESIINPAPNLVLPILVKWGLGMPRDDFLGWTDAATATQKFSTNSTTTPDFHGHTPRPWGAGASIGCWQIPDIVKDTSSAITGGGTNSIKFTGAGEISLYIPVDAVGQTISIATKSTSYGGTNYPQMVVVANPAIGVFSDTTATASSASEQTITTATITPTAKGVMEVRLISRSTSATSSTFFDILSST